MTQRTVVLVAALGTGVAAAFLPSTLTEARQMPTPAVYAIRGARIVTGAGATIDKGNLVMRNGVIADVGAAAAIPAEAVVVDGTSLTVYPGLIDMSNPSAVEVVPAEEGLAPVPALPAGGGRAGRGATDQTWADADRAKREALLNADFDASRHVRYDGVEMRRLAAAGITSVLAVPSAGLIRGQSALVNVVAPPDDDDVSRVAGYRRGTVVVRAPVAQHVVFGGRGGGGGRGGFPAALLGGIAFVRQAFYDAAWQQEARAWAEKHADQPRPTVEPALDALLPALDGRMPVAFEAGELREILRALAMAKEFKLDPIITGGIEAAEAAPELKAANAKVILTFDTGGGGGRGGRGGETSMRVTRMQQNLPKVPAALEKAGIPYAFASQGTQAPADFLRGVSRAVRDGGLTPDQALRALTASAARMARAGDRLGTLEKGRIANVIAVEGDLFAEGARIRRVFVDGAPVNIDLPPAAAQPGGRRGTGGH